MRLHYIMLALFSIQQSQFLCLKQFSKPGKPYQIQSFWPYQLQPVAVQINCSTRGLVVILRQIVSSSRLFIQMEVYVRWGFHVSWHWEMKLFHRCSGLSFYWMHGPGLAEFMHSDDLFELTADLKVCILSLFCSICILLDFWCSMISMVFCLIVIDKLSVWWDIYLYH
ncbi:hypothetical protein ES288_A01G136200v1 [Gossypium darwinii]|uniref:Uncharacterized protein n=2 Tax=Gossypium TaxID=3633 RepID=A0A5D2RQM4_GOSTO|nr:hypothetical protein ES288_A01G136200v1 [Gossypium darwinii]TYI43089.1 hypothetical protein ES332_A01G144800v1 [Gossypium tomentosum]